MNSEPRLVVILGPTASGKSALAICLAEKLSGEVVVCDSTQVYRGFDIGTAKVPFAEQQGIPHHLADLVAPEALFTAGQYRERAIRTLRDISSRGRLPILAAGTGLYLRALLEGLADAPARSEELRVRLREIVERKGFERLHKILARFDPDAAARIAPRDTQKIIRAIEISILAGRPVTAVHRSGRQPLEGFHVIKIGLQPVRPELYARIDRRVQIMLNGGWLEEVRSLMAQAPADAKPFQFIGYSQLREHLAGKLSLEDAIQQIQQATRNYAKRQLTWFRRERNVHWIPSFGDSPESCHAALEILANSAS